MNARQAKDLTQEWVRANLGTWPGLRGAHFVGGITTMPDEAPFPAHKDVDVHLIVDEGSAALEPTATFFNVVEASHGGVSIEAGVKSVAEYRSAEAVLSNPEIAYHLTVDSLIHDPSGLLRRLQEAVRREYPRRRWVLARLAHERRGLAGAFGLRPMVADRYGAAGELNILGYTTTFATAALQVAALQPPKMGNRMFIRLREVLAAYDRLDLYEKMLALLGIRHVTPDQVERFLTEATEGFDLALAVRTTPHPFQHKLHRHLRPYLVDACRSMLDEGHHREALAWVIPYHTSTTNVVLDDGPAAEKPRFEARQARFLEELGMDHPAGRSARYARAADLYDRIFALAEEIVADHPAVVD